MVCIDAVAGRRMLIQGEFIFALIVSAMVSYASATAVSSGAQAAESVAV